MDRIQRKERAHRIVEAVTASPGISNRLLAKQLGVTYEAVSYRRRLLGITSPQTAYWHQLEAMRSVPIAPDVLGCVVGTLLGDGCLILTGKSEGALPYLAVKHGAKQLEWLRHKTQRLGALVGNALGREVHDVAFGKPCVLYQFTTLRHPDLLRVRQLAYNEVGRKCVTRRLLSLLTEEGLAWWFYDDGYLAHDRRYGYPSYTLSTHSFTLEEHKLIRSFFFKRFGLKATILRHREAKDGHQLYYLHFARKTRDRLTAILKRYPVACMSYKVDRSSETTR